MKVVFGHGLVWLLIFVIWLALAITFHIRKHRKQ